MSILPKSRPQLTRERALQILERHGIADQFALIGVRGYYLNTMGKAGTNDRGIYDDAIILVTPSGYVTFNANCDPSAFRKGIATLKPGCYLYKLGIHGLSKPKPQQYRALVQAAPVTVTRDQAREETGYFGINIHRGGAGTTSSLGCQTIPPAQWLGFIAMVEQEMKRHQHKTIPYVLITEPEMPR